MRWSEADVQRVVASGQCRVLSGTLTAPAAVPSPPPPATLFPVPSPPIVVDRYRSKTERRYATMVLDVAVATGELRAYYYEPHKGLYLAPKTSYTPDFLLWFSDPTRPLEFHEVKGGHIWDKDHQKLKLAAALYPCYTFRQAQWTRGAWRMTLIPAT